MAFASHIVTVRRLKKYIDDVIGKKANLPDTNKTIIGNISQINSDLTNNICTNLLNPTEQTQTINGVTFTNNGDGTYTVNGTASGTSIINVGSGSAIKHRGKNLCLCGCPSGGGNNKYQMVMYAFDANGTIVNAWYNTGSSDRKIVPQSAVRFACGIYVYAGTTVSNLVFKPMLTTDLNAKYDDYVPYTGDSGRLNEDVSAKQNKTDNALTTTAKTIVGAINEINSDLSDKSFTVTAVNQSIKLTSFDCKRFGSMAKISMYGTTVRQLEANKAYFIPNLYINGMQNINLYGCGITRTNSSLNDGADSFPCIVSISKHSVCFTPLVTMPSNFGMVIELLCYLL